MRKIYIRIDDYMYNQLINLKDYYGTTLQSLLIELLQIGFMKRQGEILNEDNKSNKINS